MNVKEMPRETWDKDETRKKRSIEIKREQKRENREFSRAMRWGLTTLLKIKGSSAAILADSKTLIYCHC